MKPIFFAWTRSFWSAILTALLVIHDTGEPMVRSLASVVAPILGLDVESVTEFGLSILPLLTLFFAIQQRSGSARPYTMDPRALR